MGSFADRTRMEGVHEGVQRLESRRRVLILVLALDREPWRSIEVHGQRATWAAAPDPEMPVLWLHGRNRGPAPLLFRVGSKALRLVGHRPSIVWFNDWAGRWAARLPVSLRGDCIITRVPESYGNTNAKTIAAFRFVLENCDFDFILRTNSSTYVNRQALATAVQRLPDFGYYGGPLEKRHGTKYASGMGILLSRDLVAKIAADPDWDYGVIDDVAIGMSMERMGVPLRPLPRVRAQTREQLEDLSLDMLRGTFVVRCRGKDDRKHDILAMQRVHELYLSGGHG